MTRNHIKVMVALACFTIPHPIASQTHQNTDAWSAPECSVQSSNEFLLNKKSRSNESEVPRVTFKIHENFRGDILVEWNNRLRAPFTEHQIVGNAEELESLLRDVLLSELHSQTKASNKNSFSFHRNPTSKRPCSTVISAMINALQAARDSLAFQKAGMSESQLRAALSITENKLLKDAYFDVLLEVNSALPPWLWEKGAAPPPPQTTVIEIVEVEEDTPFMIVEDMPGFGPCKSMAGLERDQCTQLEIIKYVSSNTKYPPIAKDAGIQGTVFVYFVVGKDGKVRDSRVIRPVDPRLDEEALRVVSSLPAFEPGRQQGKPVSVQYTIPVKFMIRTNQQHPPRAE